MRYPEKKFQKPLWTPLKFVCVLKPYESFGFKANNIYTVERDCERKMHMDGFPRCK